ncbi:hypothetical protein QM716_06015 [Rhodococcus sp. IEGM 1409]|uniref:hypothetical protein n=1 Tax=Rhodococcus sp. IEGM 1409 TaxID=3047082 RepID=UPI0024B852D2|nr:hypothetical protein [Rhodococcus sp. IEGM 1409]MDI9899404.1 hypothetical protein [Rhodococcus sp. IEGM 1409]
MTHSDLTPTEALILLVLMSESREVPNPELKKLGPELRPASREKLNALGLIESNTEVRPFTHILTDRGWAVAAELIGADAPTGSLSPMKALYTVLAGLRRHFDRTDLRPSEVFLPRSEAPETGTATATATNERTEGEEVENLIVRTYAELAATPGAWVRLARLRPALAGTSRTEFDRALTQLQRRPNVNLIPEENQKTLTSDDRDAALFLGNQHNHLISIEAK